MKKITLIITTFLFSIYCDAQCSEPSNVRIENQYDLSIIWDANGESTWDIEYGENGFTPTGNPTTENLSTNYLNNYLLPYDIYYDFYVRADCGSETSDWVGPYTFYNFCDISMTFFVVNENFESNFIPDCWTEANQGSPNSSLFGYNQSAWELSNFANTGTNNAAKITINGTSVNEWLLLPQMQGLAGVKSQDYLILNFEIAMTVHNSTNTVTLGSDDQVKLVISPDFGTTWFTIQTWDSNSTISNTGESVAINYESYFDGFDLYEKHFLVAFWASSGVVDDGINIDFFIDNVYSEPPSTGSINDLESKGFKYYPNPAKNTININANENINTVLIYNYLGQEVKTVIVNAIQKEIDISNLQKGVYFMKIQIDNVKGFVSLIKE